MTRRIPNKQLYSRWDVLPDILKEAIASEMNSGVVWKTAEAEHLLEEKIRIVSRLAGYTLMGFIHPEDIAKEIEDNLGINPSIAASIASTLNSRIFNPLRNDLEKIYAPAIEESKGEGPVIVEEIKKPFDTAPSTSLRTNQGKPVVSLAPAGPEPREPVRAPAKTVSEMDLTSSLGVKPAVAPKLGAVNVQPAVGGPKIISTEGVSTAAPTLSTLSTTNIPQPQKPPVPPKFEESLKKEQPQGPVILHQESEFAPIKPISGFKLEIPGQKFEGTKSATGIPPRPAQIEMGSTSSQQVGSPPLAAKRPVMESNVTPPKPEPPSAGRVIHYSESRTPVVPQKQATSAPEPLRYGASMKQDARIPAPPKPPANLSRDGLTPVPAPKPPERIIKKDYLPAPLKEPELPRG